MTAEDAHRNPGPIQSQPDSGLVFGKAGVGNRNGERYLGRDGDRRCVQHQLGVNWTNFAAWSSSIVRTRPVNHEKAAGRRVNEDEVEDDSTIRDIDWNLCGADLPASLARTAGLRRSGVARSEDDIDRDEAILHPPRPLVARRVGDHRSREDPWGRRRQACPRASCRLSPSTA